jgi:hypothetical protein
MLRVSKTESNLLSCYLVNSWWAQPSTGVCIARDTREELFWNLYSSYIIEYKIKERGKNFPTFLFLGEKKL